MLLKQSHSLCSSMTTEQERHEAAYMEAVRSTVVKITYGGSGGKTLSLKEINTQINELLKASIQSQGVISLFDSKQADENISLFDPAVLDEISKMKEKNIAVEILKKLMAEQNNWLDYMKSVTIFNFDKINLFADISTFNDSKISSTIGWR